MNSSIIPQKLHFLGIGGAGMKLEREITI